jgi:PrgI family protein
MASYQIPQFLDSGDKIFLSMNIRQFAYFMVGFFVSVVVYSITQSIYPPIGIYAAIPALPFVGFFAFLSLGHYNGRDSEVYVLKVIIYLTKPRSMRYQRNPDTQDLDQKLQEITYEKISKKWLENASNQKAIESNIYNSFDDADNASKINQIRSLSKQVDTVYQNATITVLNQEKTKAKAEEIIQKIEDAKKQARANQPKFSFPTLTKASKTNNTNTASPQSQPTASSNQIRTPKK